MALALSTWKSVANKGASSGARDEYKFRIVQSSVNSTTHTASYKVQFYGTDTSRYGSYEHYMNAVKLKVNGTTVATLLNSKIHMGSGRSSGYTAKYSSSSPYTTSSYSRSSSYTKYQSGSNSESMNLISRALLTEDEILRIERPYVLVIQAGLYPIITKLPDISKWRFNKLFGMGNQEENRQLRLKREQAREQKEIEDIKLWGIWNLYR